MRILILCVVLFLIDFYVFQAFRTVSRDLGPNAQKGITLIFWSLTVFCLGTVLAAEFLNWHSWPKAFRTYLFAFIFIVYFSKLFILIFLLADDVLRFFQWMYKKLFGNRENTEIVYPASNAISRSDFLMKAGLMLGAVPFLSLLYGMMKGAFSFRVRKVNLSLKELPGSFKGLKILHISDIHSGSFNSAEPLERAVELILAQEADVIFFTGDLVNDRSTEAEPFLEIFKKIQAPLGVYSTLGNHDYGDYVQWPSREEKAANLEHLKQIHHQIGWKLLLDEHDYLEKEGEKIGIIGIQNWSAHLRFPKYGSMERAVSGFEPASVNLLLSHDPSHWRAEVLERYPEVDLMFAGHTHGFQFGIEIPGIKWSPVQYVYKEWAGLYSENNKHLYVNRGLGFLGYPGRVGIMPEITVITLNNGTG